MIKPETKSRLMSYLNAYKKFVKYEWYKYLKIIDIVWVGSNVDGFICEVIKEIENGSQNNG